MDRIPCNMSHNDDEGADNNNNNNNNNNNCNVVPVHAMTTCWSAVTASIIVNTLNAKLNPICHLLTLLGAHHILHVSRIRDKSHLSSAGIIRSSPYSAL